MGAAGRLMRLTGSNSPDRMLTDQFDSRSESTRTLHSFPSQVTVAMARVVPEGFSMRDSVYGARRRRYLPRDTRRVRLDPDHRDEPDDHHQKRDVEEPAIVLLTLLPHRADPGKLARRDPPRLAFAADEIVGRDDAAPVELQELLLGADSQLPTRMAHVELHRLIRWRRPACSASKHDTLRCEIG